MVQWICLILLIQLIHSTTDRYLFSNFYIESDDPLIINSTSKTTFLCTKQNGNDEEDFEITTHPTIPFDEIRIYENRLNNTSIELTIHSIDYIGMFTLICSSLNHKSIGKELDVIVGAPPDAMTHVDNCTVYDNQYIDCTIHAPILSRAIHNKYPCHFDMMETHSSVYKQPSDSIQVDILNKTITFRWLPVKEGVFPDDIDILIIGEMRFFGKTNVTINLTPRFLIKPNFTLQVFSSSNIQIQFHQNHFGDLICRGNTTIDEQSKEQDTRLFKERNPTKLNITHLLSNTWYKICFQCHRLDNFTTTTEILCQRIRTQRSIYWTFCLIIVIGILVVIIIGIAILTFTDWGNRIKRTIFKPRRSPVNLEEYEGSRMTNELNATDICVPDLPSIPLDVIFTKSTFEENPTNETMPLTTLTTE